LGVLPGTGGLTRLVDKRKVRRDLADLFCTNADGVRAERAKNWGLVDATASPNRFPECIRERAEALAATSDRPLDAKGITLNPLHRRVSADGLTYRHVDVAFDRARRRAEITVRAPDKTPPLSLEAIESAGDGWWPLAMARELDDAILMLRTNEPELGLWVLRTAGDADPVLDVGRTLAELRGHWLVRETTGLLRRTLARLEVSSRSLYAVIDRQSCFAGLLFELALAADRSYMLMPIDADDGAPAIVVDQTNLGLFPTITGRSRLESRFNGDPASLDAARHIAGRRLGAAEAEAAGLVTIACDELDWNDEIRLALEERASLSPDALTGLEASLRFTGSESLESKVFGRLSAWQNWVFNRPNATGEHGALKLFGSGAKPQFDWERV
jgi:benzoyl-CoA-dihydrodiol lyase